MAKCGGCGLVNPDGTETCRRCSAPFTGARASKSPETFRGDSYVVAIDDVGIFILRTGMAAAPIGHLVVEAIEQRMADKEAVQRPLARLGPISEMRTRVDCQANQLPAEITSRTDFPKLSPGTSVSIYPKQVVESVAVSMMSGLRIKVRDDTRSHPLAIAFWAVGRARRALTERGYHVL